MTVWAQWWVKSRASYNESLTRCLRLKNAKR